jgi:hypothetical protein
MVPKEVFHYTTARTALEKILTEIRLKVGQLRLANDPKESGAYSFDDYISPSDENDDIPKLWVRLRKMATRIKLDEWKILCFCKDHDDSEFNRTAARHDPFFKGYNRPTMWAHYADNHRGVCLTFDGEKLDAQIRLSSGRKYEVLPDGGLNYVDNNSDAIGEPINTQEISKLSDVQLEGWLRAYFHRNYRVIFLQKFNDWQSESEYRWIFHSKESQEFYIPIGNTV